MQAVLFPRTCAENNCALTIDIHSHILPGLDDGSVSWDMTLEMYRQAAEYGITHMVASPHANESYPYDRNRVRKTVVELDRRIGDQITFIIGCDFHVSYDNVEDAILQPQRYTIAAKNYLLLELSDYGFVRFLAAGTSARRSRGGEWPPPSTPHPCHRRPVRVATHFIFFAFQIIGKRW
jgi:Capsular polysaccharide synthesis, CpsB/CapC